MPISRPFALLLALSTLSAGAFAQSADPSVTGSSSNNIQTQPAPITRGAAHRFIDTQPVLGVWVHADANSTVTTVSANKGGTTEIRLERGRANLQINHPAEHSLILVDLPGGQTALLKDGLYTFNAETNTVRVLHGEAEVYPGAADTKAKAIKIKEDHELSFTGSGNLKSVEADPREIASDLLPAGGPEGAPMGRGYAAPGYGYGPYGDGYPVYPYPYVAYGYPYYGWGYPFGFGLGFGYYGGFGGGFYGGRFGRR
jgi:hypothetical protein